mgnify:CR=1 FL=1
MASDDKTERTEVSAVPLYQQVMDDLKGEIARGVYASGSRIPSEMELAKYYGVGRITVRRAVEELSRAGYLNRQQGRGTFVCAPKLKRKIVQKGDVQSFSEGCAANDMVAGARLVSRTVVAATREDAAFLVWNPAASSSLSSACARQTACPSCSRTTPLCWPTIPICRRLRQGPHGQFHLCARCRAFGPRAAQVRPLYGGDCACRCSGASLLEVPVASRSSIWRRTLPMRTSGPCCSDAKRSWARATCSTSNVHR